MKLNTKAIKDDAKLSAAMLAWGLVPVGLTAISTPTSGAISIITALALLILRAAWEGRYTATDPWGQDAAQ